MGVAAFRELDKVKQLSAQRIDAEKIDQAKKQLRQFKDVLGKFARKHKQEIEKDPDFRDAFHEMCSKLQVDPLQSRTGFWGKVLRIGDFYHELAVKVIDSCDSLKRKYGSLVPVEEVIDAVRRTYGSSPPKISPGDIERAMKALKEIGQGYTVVVHGGRRFLKTVSFDLDADGMKLLESARDQQYFQFNPKMEMTEQRFNAAVTPLLNEGLVWIDRPAVGPPRYWVVAFFPGFH
jgi:ESCRT-II complex subunit VPS22